eukprot:6665253-Lingulodinium_polyedra.AAC.1
MGHIRELNIFGAAAVPFVSSVFPPGARAPNSREVDAHYLRWVRDGWQVLCPFAMVSRPFAWRG